MDILSCLISFMWYFVATDFSFLVILSAFLFLLSPSVFSMHAKFSLFSLNKTLCKLCVLYLQRMIPLLQMKCPSSLPAFSGFPSHFMRFLMRRESLACLRRILNSSINHRRKETKHGKFTLCAAECIGLCRGTLSWVSKVFKKLRVWVAAHISLSHIIELRRKHFLGKKSLCHITHSLVPWHIWDKNACAALCHGKRVPHPVP